MTFKSPVAIVYTFDDPIPTEANGSSLELPVPLFTRVGIPYDTYPKWLRTNIETVRKPVDDNSTGGTVFSGRQKGMDTWVLQSVKVSLSRFWACSTAMFTLTLPLTDPEMVVPAVPAHPEMPISIAFGYEDTNGSIMYNIPTTEDVERVFTGYIDTISYKFTDTQVVAVIACRDSIRFLTDNKLTGVFTDENSPVQSLSIAGDRTETIKKLILEGCGKFDNGFVPLNEARLAIPEDFESPNPNEEPRWDPSGRKPIGFTDASDTKEGQAGLASQVQTHQLFAVITKHPIEVIKHLSSVEDAPREFYSDRLGNIIWERRKTRKLNKPYDFYFRNKVAIDQGQTQGVFPIFNASAEWSTVGTMTEFIVVNTQPQSANTGLGGSFCVEGKLETRKALGFDMASRSRFVFDDTMEDRDQTDVSQTEPFLSSMLTLWGKDVKAGSVEVEGIPLLQPSDAIRIWNMGIFPAPYNIFRAEAVIHSYNAVGKKGYRTSIMFSELQEHLDHKTRTFTYEQTISGPGKPETTPKPVEKAPPAPTPPTQEF
jgi:hypothetical protein